MVTRWQVEHVGWDDAVTGAALNQHRARGAVRTVRLHRWAGLASLLLALSLAVVLLPDLPVAAPNPEIAIAVATLTGAVGLMLVYLGVVCFRVAGRPLELVAGLAFGTVAVTTLALHVIGSLAGVEPARPETTVALLLLPRL